MIITLMLWFFVIYGLFSFILDIYRLINKIRLNEKEDEKIIK